MSEIGTEVMRMVDDNLKNVADGVLMDLRKYAIQHKRTGDLARNIRRVRLQRNTVYAYRIEGGSLSGYRDNRYHPIVFFTSESGKRALTDALKSARDKLNK